MRTTLIKHTGETMLCDFDCSQLLAASETITSVSQVSASPVTDPAITFGSPAINTVPAQYPDGYTVPAGQVVQVLIGGGSIPAVQRAREYVITVSFATSTAGELRQAKGRLLVTDEPV